MEKLTNGDYLQSLIDMGLSVVAEVQLDVEARFNDIKMANHNITDRQIIESHIRTGNSLQELYEYVCEFGELP